MSAPRDRARSPREALRHAEYVVTADVGRRSGTVAGAHVYQVSTVGLPVLKGEEVGHRELSVVVTPEPCPAGDCSPGGAGCPHIDPVAGLGRAVFFLRWDDDIGYWRTLTPGVLPLTGAGDTLPGRWPGSRGDEEAPAG